MMRKKIPQIILLLGFLSIIYLPSIDMIFNIGPQLAQTEHRNLAPKPQLVFKKRELRRYPKYFETYYNDHFGFRQVFIRFYQKLGGNRSLLSGGSFVSEGKDGWLFHTPGTSIIDDYRAVSPMSDAELNQWQLLLEQRKQWLKQHGIEHLVIIAPAKHSVYPEYLPARLKKVGTLSRAEQLTQHLQRNSNVSVIALHQVTRDAKQHGQVFAKGDTHWNDLAGYYAYQYIMKSLGSILPGEKALPVTAFDQTWLVVKGLELNRMAGEPLKQERIPRFVKSAPNCVSVASFQYSSEHLRVKRHDRPLALECNDLKKTKRLLVIRDSFFDVLLPFLPQHFKRSVLMWNDYGFDSKTILREKPDVVIEQWMERKLIGAPLANENLGGD